MLCPYFVNWFKRIVAMITPSAIRTSLPQPSTPSHGLAFGIGVTDGGAARRDRVGRSCRFILARIVLVINQVSQH